MCEVTITLTRYKEPNRLLFETLSSLALQKNISAKVLMLDQQSDDATKKYCETRSNKDVQFDYIVIDTVWLSYARNYAIKMCATDILLCIDADAIADENWAYELTEAFAVDERIGIVWGKILPKFHKTPPFFLKANFIYDMYSLLDNGEENWPTSKIVWASYGIHLWRMWSEAFLDLSLWRRPWVLLWWEETDLCKRAKSKWLLIYYCWRSIILHQILPERLTYIRIMKRAYRWWYSRYVQWGVPTPNNTKSTMWTYIIGLLILPVYGTWYISAWRRQVSAYCLKKNK